MNTELKNPDYETILTHTDSELKRLIDQGRFYGELTGHVFQLAGIGPGMRVLDIGCGTGEVSFLVSRMVGADGEVIGIDKSAKAVSAAKSRAKSLGIGNVRFITADLNTIELEEQVDGLVGRLILMYFSDPAVLLRRLSQFVRPGGVIAFHELDATGVKSLPRCELFEQTAFRIKETLDRVGAHSQMGLKLPQTFLDAGLPLPELLLTGRLGFGPNTPAYNQVAEIVRTLLPMMERTGIATADEIDIDTLENRLCEEAVANQATLVAPPFIGAWTRC